MAGIATAFREPRTKGASRPRAGTPTLRFLGAAGTVTGSKFLLTTGGARILVDCGLFQGPRALREQNWAQLPVDPHDIDAVVLTHAHLDHVGYLPLLARHGFRGPVFATAATADLARIVLADSGRLQEEEAEYANRKGYSKHHPAVPLYTEEDAAAAARLFTTVRFGESLGVGEGISASWHRAGHILGSATVSLHLAEPERRLLVSGDLGRRVHPLLQPPEAAADADVVLIESTYGDRTHEETEESLERLAEVIGRTIDRGGVVVLPSFAVDRTEVILYWLGRLMERTRIPRVPVYVDSPMALAVLDVYRRAITTADPELRELRTDPFAAAGELHECRSVEQSRALNGESRAIIIASSGMATGGRVLHHLAQRLPDSRSSVVLLGYQSPGTRGHQLVQGAPVVKMLGRYVPVHATVTHVDGFSVHADSDELVDWLGTAPRQPEMTYVVHGEPESAAALRHRVTAELARPAVVPAMGEVIRLD